MPNWKRTRFIGTPGNVDHRKCVTKGVSGHHGPLRAFEILKRHRSRRLNESARIDAAPGSMADPFRWAPKGSLVRAGAVLAMTLRTSCQAPFGGCNRGRRVP